MPDTARLSKMDPDDLLAELRRRAAGDDTTSGEGKRSAAAAAPSKPHPELADYDDAQLAKAVRSTQKVIYGADDRVEVFTLAGANLTDADSVVSLFESAAVNDNGDGTTSLVTENFGTARNLCASERFRDQPIGAFCSGFLVAPDVVATAGHCVNGSNVTDVRFVFGFRMSNATTAVTKVPSAEVYSGVNVIGRAEVSDGPDWALVRIDRSVLNHKVVKVRRTGKIPDAQGLHVIGHPVGLPAKFAGGATVRDNTGDSFFVANLDTYGGNSGSPVFNKTTHEVEGVLVRGETDFVEQGGCSISLVCPSTGCRGEDVTRLPEFSRIVPVTSIWPGGFVYFFKGSQYSRFNTATNAVDAGWPKPIAGNWPGFPVTFAAGVSAAVMWTNGKAYFFKGSEYIRFDVAANKVDAGYPKPIAGNWPGVFTSNIDAVIVWNNGKAYFFKGTQYLRYDLATDAVDAGFPRTIAPNWGFPAAFASIGAAVMWHNGKAYFFKGTQYLRYDVSAAKVDTNWPKPIAGNWPGLFTGDISA